MVKYYRLSKFLSKKFQISDLDWCLITFLIKENQQYSQIREQNILNKYSDKKDAPFYWFRTKVDGWGKVLYFTREYLAEKMSSLLNQEISKEEISKSLHKWSLYLGDNFWTKPSKEEKNQMFHKTEIKSRNIKDNNPFAWPNVFRNLPTRRELKKIIYDKIMENFGFTDYKQIYDLQKRQKEENRLKQEETTFTKEERMFYEKYMNERKKKGLYRFIHLSTFAKERRKKIKESEERRNRDKERRQLFKQYLLKIILQRVESFSDPILEYDFLHLIKLGEINDFGITCVQIMKKLNDIDLRLFIENELLGRNKNNFEPLYLTK